MPTILENPPEAPIPQRYVAPESKGKTNRNCLIGCFALVVITPLLIAGTLYFVMMHTSAPLRPIVAAINDSGTAKISGFDGSVSSGFSATEIRIYTTAPGLGDTYFTDVSFKFNGVVDLFRNDRLIIDGFHIGKANFAITGGGGGEGGAASAPDDGTPTMKGDVETIGPPTPGPTTTTTTYSHYGGGSPAIGLIEIHSFRVDEIVITHPGGDQTLGSVSLVGMRLADGDFSIKETEVVSDHISVSLNPAAESGPFRQILRGTVRPTLADGVYRDIEFTLAFNTDGGGSGRSEFTAFDGAVVITGTDVGGGGRISGFTARDYLDPSWAAMPDNLTLDYTWDDVTDRITIGRGSFSLGASGFTISPQEADDSPGRPSVTAHSDGPIDDREVTVTISKTGTPPFFRYRFESVPPAPGDELAPMVLFGKRASELDDAETAELQSYLPLSSNPPVTLSPEKAPLSQEAAD